ncbi:MAG: PD-(D/E)XK nuclease family protein, partial [Chloroflexota bacterium]|nr:PD-(D/E)XK nuclease family protein [Chloroflexota bacterium]
MRFIAPVELGATPWPIAPTDLSQFVRLDQCERYLRLRLHERSEGRGFMRDYGVTPQSIPPILTRSGEEFENLIESAVARHFPTTRFGPAARQAARRADDNALLLDLARDLPPGEVIVLFQPRLQAPIAGWAIRGDVDILRLERKPAGNLRPLIADIKSSTAAKIEHRLQVAFYHEMLTTLFATAGIAHDPIEMAVLYRGPTESVTTTDETELARQESQRQSAERVFGTRAGLLESVDDAEAYLGAVRDLVTSPNSRARRVLRTDFAEIPFHLTYKCDGCLYNEFCMKRSAETDDLSLVPHLTEQDKRALQRGGVSTVHELAALKSLRLKGRVARDDEPRDQPELIPNPGMEPLTRRLATTWPVGQRLDELIHRALRYQKWKKEPVEALTYIPGNGYASLPYSGADQDPNLIRIYIDAQHDYLHDRLYMLGALVVACEAGVEVPSRRRSLVRLSEGPPDTHAREEALFVDLVSVT